MTDAQERGRELARQLITVAVNLDPERSADEWMESDGDLTSAMHEAFIELAHNGEVAHYAIMQLVTGSVFILKVAASASGRDVRELWSEIATDVLAPDDE